MSYIAAHIFIFDLLFIFILTGCAQIAHFCLWVRKYFQKRQVDYKKGK